MANDNVQVFMGYLWVQSDGDTITLGVNEDGLSDVESILKADLPAENDEVNTEEICGELDTSDGPINLYSPIDGKVLEVNSAVVEDPSLILEDPTGDGWLIKIEGDASAIEALAFDANEDN